MRNGVHTPKKDLSSAEGVMNGKKMLKQKRKFTQNILMCMRFLHPSAIRHSNLPRLLQYFVHMNEGVRKRARWENLVVWSGL